MTIVYMSWAHLKAEICSGSAARALPLMLKVTSEDNEISSAGATSCTYHGHCWCVSRANSQAHALMRALMLAANLDAVAGHIQLL